MSFVQTTALFRSFLPIALAIFASAAASAGTLDGRDLPTIQQNRIVLDPLGHTAFPEVFCNLGAVEQIEIFENSLATLPSCIGRFGRTLRKLSISKNDTLKSLPIEVGQLVFLETLMIKQSGLMALPSQISGAKKLRNLQITNSKLTSLPKEVGELISLETLDLANNALTVLPDEMGLLTSLSSLNLSGNSLKATPWFLPYLVNLKTLTLTGNPLASDDAQKQVIKNIFKDRQIEVIY